MYNKQFIFCISFLGFISLNFGEELDTTGVRRHFEWGEYDSLLLKLPSILSQSPSASASLRATFWQYLGTAYFVGGDSLRAKECYTSAWEIDKDVVLDKKYLNDASVNFFNRVFVELSAAKQDTSEIKDTVLPERDTLAIAQTPPDTSIPIVLKTISKKKGPPMNPAVKKAIGWGLIALGLGLTHFALTEQEENDEIYKKYQNSARFGVDNEYFSLKEELEESNLKLLAFTAVAVISSGTGLFFAFYPFLPTENKSSGPDKLTGIFSFQYRASF